VTEIGPEEALSRTAASAAVEGLGWRYLLGTLSLSAAVRSLSDAAQSAGTAITAAGNRADGHLRIDLRPDLVVFSLQNRARGVVTGADVQLAERISAAVGEAAGASGATTSRDAGRPVQMLELAIDALDIPAIRPFWKAVLAYADEPSGGSPEDALVDSFARSFWVLADTEGNEVCVCTWQDRDER
jgi:4a-hydroxytetrahydrobiopterin dehydratase